LDFSVEVGQRRTARRPPPDGELKGKNAGRLLTVTILPNRFKPFQSTGAHSSTMDAPSFSPFPKVQGENIPPTDEEKEQILWQARDLVLHSNNVSMQVTWARDALIYVEIAAEAAARDWKRDGKGRERPATPKAEHELRIDAVNIIDYLAGQNHPEATFMKAKWLEFGKFGFRENKREAYALYKQAAANDFGRAEYRMGMLYENSNDIQNAIKHYGLGVQLKDSASHYRLGMMHLMGQHGHPKDILLGLDMIQTAADTADEDAPQGAYVYGMLIARELPDINLPEDILPYDLSVARQYIEKAAYLGFAKAQLKMGQAYELSQLGCDFNPSYSLHYYGLAARQGVAEAALGVSRWFLFGFEGSFAKNEALAFKHARDAADSGLHTGEFAMGYYYEIGIHVQKDVREARRWYEKAAEHGNKDALARIESLSQSKTLTKQDHETTTLTRIKSQHGSQRGKRPERFARRDNDVLPSLAEGPNTPTDGNFPGGAMQPSPGRGGRMGGSPMHRPVIVEDTIDFPDPSRGMVGGRPPAFTVNLDGSNLAIRSKSAAPYPEDDRPPPLTLGPGGLRPKSAAPYPEDDLLIQNKPLSPHYNPAIRPSSGSGPVADRPMSAFGIRPASRGAEQGQGPVQGQGRGRGAPGAWEPQVPSGYRQPSPGPGPGAGRGVQGSTHWQPQPPPHQQSYHDNQAVPPRLGAASVGPGVTVPVGAGGPVGDPTRARLTKNNPNMGNPKPLPAGPGPQQQYGGAQPGRDYGPRTSSGGSGPGPRPVSDVYDQRYHGGGGPPAGAAGAAGRPLPPQHAATATGANGRVDSMSSAATHQSRLTASGGAGRASAPPAQSGRPSPGPGTPAMGAKPPGGPAKKPVSSASSVNSNASSHPSGKTTGPSTFEEMGIPQGKNESDCVSALFLLLLNNAFVAHC